MAWTLQELAERMAQNPALKISGNPLASPKASKYRNVKTESSGIVFDSKKESKRYEELKLMERAGEIRNLTLQPKYPIIVEGIKICVYRADFTYQTKQGQTVVEDVKGIRTQAYGIKKKLMRAVYSIEILET